MKKNILFLGLVALFATLFISCSHEVTDPYNYAIHNRADKTVFYSADDSICWASSLTGYDSIVDDGNVYGSLSFSNNVFHYYFRFADSAAGDYCEINYRVGLHGDYWTHFILKVWDGDDKLSYDMETSKSKNLIE